MSHLTDVLNAVSHPTRRAIIERLTVGPTRFSDVAGEFDTALNAVSKHLKLLERAGLISKEKQGREVFISLQAEPLKEIAAWVHHYERFWNDRLNSFEDFFVKQQKAEKRERKKTKPKI